MVEVGDYVRLGKTYPSYDLLTGLVCKVVEVSLLTCIVQQDKCAIKYWFHLDDVELVTPFEAVVHRRLWESEQ